MSAPELPSAEDLVRELMRTRRSAWMYDLVDFYTREVLEAAAKHLHKTDYEAAAGELRAWVRKLEKDR